MRSVRERSNLHPVLTQPGERQFDPSGRTLGPMSTVDLSDAVVRELVAEFGDDAPQVAEKVLRTEITRHRIERAVKGGADPAAAVAEALAKDQGFLTEVERLDAAGEQTADDLVERLRRSTG